MHNVNHAFWGSQKYTQKAWSTFFILVILYVVIQLCNYWSMLWLSATLVPIHYLSWAELSSIETYIEKPWYLFEEISYHYIRRHHQILPNPHTVPGIIESCKWPPWRDILLLLEYYSNKSFYAYQMHFTGLWSHSSRRRLWRTRKSLVSTSAWRLGRRSFS